QTCDLPIYNIQNWNETVSENNSFGINVEWAVTDNFNMTFDANFAESEQNPGGEFNQWQAIVGYRNQQRFRIIDGAEIPVVQDIYNANPGRTQATFCGDPTIGENPNWPAAGLAHCLAYASANGITPGQDSAIVGSGAQGEIATVLLRAHRNGLQSGNTRDEVNRFKSEGERPDDKMVLRAGMRSTEQTKNNRLK